jgi:hypothetical protein
MTMTIFSRLFRRSDITVSGALARKRLGASMPGEAAALAANRYGVLVS